jgi:alkanesulfonate monooxygenase SsuD/methylene tetrahydromethanopterin reductase-like flavin-dependent oxidoreductase (luciferase family)
VTGQRWPSANERRELLKEAIAVMRSLWEGGLVEHRGRGYQVIDAQLFTLPAEPPPIYVAAAGPIAAEFAAEVGDGLIATTPQGDVVATFEEHGGRGNQSSVSSPSAGHPTNARRSIQP